MTSFQLFGLNRDGCHIWGRKCSLYPKHLFLSLWGVRDFTHSLYIHYILLNLSVLGLCVRIHYSDLFAWISRNVLSRTYCIIELNEIKVESLPIIRVIVCL